MTFAVTLPLSGYAGWTFLQRTRARQEAALAADPAQQRAEAYFRDRIGTVKTADQLVKDRRLMQVALGAFGLSDDLGKTYFIRKVLADGTGDKTDLANRLSDKRYSELSKSFQFDKATPATQASGFADTIVKAYRSQKFQEAVGTANESMRLALFAEEQLPQLAEKSVSDAAKWYSVIGSTALSKVFQGAFGLPSSFATIDVDLQVTMLERKAKQVLGTSSPTQFTDGAKVEKLIKLFLLRSGGTGAAQGSAALNALTLLSR